jgi:hypothetical protein
MAKLPKDEEFTKFLEMLEGEFVSLLLAEGWDYIVDNMVHELYDPEDFGENENSFEWNGALADTEVNATQALATFFETRLEQITGHEYKIMRGAPIPHG